VFWRVEVTRVGSDPAARALRSDLEAAGIRGLAGLRCFTIYFLEGQLDAVLVERVAAELFSDPVNERFRVMPGEVGRLDLEVIPNPGVTDPGVASIVRALADAGLEGCRVRTARGFVFGRALLAGERRLAGAALMNPLIEHAGRPGEVIFVQGRAHEGGDDTVPLRGLEAEELARVSREGLLALSRGEMLVLQRHYEALGRDPTRVELETFAQTWSEHCQHKTFRGVIDDGGRRIENLLKSTVFRVTRELAPDWCLSVFHDNSGAIEFDEQHAITFKVETHNHPSALEPYGGAATGIGGVIRDCLGTGQGAKPILNTDVFCFAPASTDPRDVPAGVLHPRRVMRGVVAGVRDYGNRMGIPTANGAVVFDEGFMGNPLVFCGTLGLIPRDRLGKRVRKGQDIVLLGGRTGRDGVHGVTFASLELEQASQEMSGGAVQIGNPIEEKKLADVMLAARDAGLVSATTDCGGGGLSSSVGELASTSGCEVWLDRVPLKYEGLTPAEIWISEAQERMVIFTARSKTERLLRLCRENDVVATVIGRTTGTGRLELRYGDREVGDIEMKFLHHGWQGVARTARWEKPETPDPAVRADPDLAAMTMKLLQAPNIASKEWVVRQYDHEVQGRSVTKPFCGPQDAGPTDACVITPVPGSKRACVVACGLRPRYGLIDPYWMAAAAIDEALRNCTAAGGDIERTAVLDNFCWGSPERPDQLAGLVRAAQACYDVAKGYRVPFISGKDSLYNEFRTAEGESVPIPPTLLVSAVSVIPDGRQTATPDFKAAGSLVYVVGETLEELGGSEYFRIHQGLGSGVPKVDAARGRRLMRQLGRAIRSGLVRACHDVSEGGLGVCLAEMAFAGGLGAEVQLRKVPGARRFGRDDFLLFSESNTRFVCEIGRPHRRRFETMMAGLPFAQVGKVVEERTLTFHGLHDGAEARLDLVEAERRWRRALTKYIQ
jgi:phosphoribosylformylglycinamidine synthase II